MPEAKGRRDMGPGRPPRPRSKPQDEGLPQDDEPDAPEGRAVAQQEAPGRPEDGDEFGFDPEVNSRYEEIKRGSTHISELQQMTIPQLLKTAKDENLSEYTGL